MSSEPNHQYHKAFTTQPTKKFEELVKKVQPKAYNDEELMNQFKFNSEEYQMIKKTYQKYAYKLDLMDKRRFRNSLGILAMDNACFLADRIFELMDTDRDGLIRFFDFLKYLDVIMNRDPQKKAEMSFRFIDRDNKDRIVYEDIEYLITKVALFWKELTGQVIVPSRGRIDEIFGALDPKNTGEVRLSDFQKMYYNEDCYFQWFEFFNQDEITDKQIEKQIAKIENDEILLQRSLLTRVEIETNLQNMEQEVTQLIVQLKKIQSKYKELQELEIRQRQMKQQEYQQQKLIIKLNQVQYDKNDISQQQSFHQNAVSSTQENYNHTNLISQRSKMKNGQTPQQSTFTTANEEERQKLLKHNEIQNKQSFELVQNQAFHQQNLHDQSQNIQANDQKWVQLIKQNGEIPAEFASSSSSSSVAVVMNKKQNQRVSADTNTQNILQKNVNNNNPAAVNARIHPSIDFSTVSTTNTNFMIGNVKLQYPQGRTSLANQTDNTLDLSRQHKKGSQQIDLDQQGRRSIFDAYTQRNYNGNNISIQNPSSKRTSGTQFDQSSYYELNNYMMQKPPQQQQPQQEKSSSFVSNLFNCGGISDIFEKKQFESSSQKGDEDTESKKSKRRYKIFDTTPVSLHRAQQDEMLKFPTQPTSTFGQRQGEANSKQEQKFNTYSNNAVAVANNEGYQNMLNNGNLDNQQMNANNTNPNSNQSLTKQQKEKLQPTSNQFQDVSNDKGPILQIVNRSKQPSQIGSTLSPIMNHSKSNPKKSSISLNFGSSSDLSLISGDLFNQPPISNEVNGPLMINLRTDQNLGDNDPQTEDETDYNNNRPFLEKKFEFLENRQRNKKNGSPKRTQTSVDQKYSPISGASSQTDILSQKMRNKKASSSNFNNKRKSKSPTNTSNRFKMEQSDEETYSQLEVQQPSYDKNEDSQMSDEQQDQEEEFKSTSKAVEFVSEEYKKIEKQIQNYITQISQYQEQLDEINKLIEDQNTNKKNKNEITPSNKKQNANQLVPNGLSAVIDEESYQPSLASNHQINSKKLMNSQMHFSMNPFAIKQTTSILQGPTNEFGHQQANIKQTVKIDSSKENQFFPPQRYHTFSPQLSVNNGYSSNHNSNTNINNNNGMYSSKKNENSSENFYLRRNTIKNIPALLSDKENKSAADKKNRNLQLFIGHDNWNLILEMMLVIRSAIKSLKKINHPALQNHGVLVTNQSNQNDGNNNNNNNQMLYSNINGPQQQMHNPYISQYNQSYSYINHQNPNHNQSSLAYLDQQQANLQNSAIIQDKKFINQIGNVSCILQGTMVNTQLPMELKTKDFETHNQQMLFNTVSNTNYQFAQLEYIDYCPLVFESLRRNQNISQEKFLRSLGPENLIGNLIMGRMSQISELCRSSTEPFQKFQYYSECGSFIVKVVPEIQAKYFLKILPNYYQFIVSQPNSLLLRIYGMYKIQTRQDKTKTVNNVSNKHEFDSSSEAPATILSNNGGNPQQKINNVYFIVCQNVFNTNLSINHRFQIKGSKKGRKAVKKNNPQPNSTLPKKDLDWIESNIRIRIDLQLKQQILNQLCSDSHFLAANKLLNYCALIGVHNFSKQSDVQAFTKNDNLSSLQKFIGEGNSPNDLNDNKNQQVKESAFSKIVSSDKKQIFFLGLINIFTEYTAKKKFIAFFKDPLFGGEQTTVNPQKYTNRLLEFFQQKIFD